MPPDGTMRLRRRGGLAKTELDYTRRYRVPGDARKAAVAGAAADGFDASAADYECEIDWSPAQQTVSFSLEKDVALAGGNGTDLPSAADSCSAAVANMPGKLGQLNGNGWAKGILQEAYIYEPVMGKRWTGQHPDVDDKISIEVWYILKEDGTGTEPFVEISFKSKHADKAKAKRDTLKSILTDKGWIETDCAH